jgi:DNA-directed RNA polymerase alpha subunit
MIANYKSDTGLSIPHPLLDLKIEYVPGFTLRTVCALMDSNKETIADLVVMTKVDILKVRNAGRREIANVEAVLKAFGLQLGMTDVQLDAMREG